MNGTDTRIGMIGIGAMGWPMSRRLVEAGYTVAVYDLDHARADEFAAKVGGTAAHAPAELAGAADIIITMLPHSGIVADVLTGADGALPAIRPGTVVVEMSSGVPARTIEIGQRLAAAGVHMVDAPVSGGVPRAETGELTIMLGGEEAEVARVEPVLGHLGSSLLRIGALGSGHAMKALNNLVSAGGFLIGVEAMVIGRKFGLDPGVMVDVLNASTGMNNSTQKKFKQYVLSRAFNSGFRLDLMVKDLTIALGIANEGHVAAPFSSLCRELWEGALNAGHGPDHTALAQFSEKLGGCELS
ncbi:NAD(P)-dependent oxidoreductase [Pseudochelatococcus sp. B33]